MINQRQCHILNLAGLWRACCHRGGMENRLHLQAPWHEVKEKLKEVNTSLTDEDLSCQPGKEEEMIERLSAKTGRTPEEIRIWIESVSANRGKAS
jgi:hypothetical protein